MTTNVDQPRSAQPAGLEGVVAAETRLSDVDGEGGRLIVGGHDIEALAGRVGFEDVCGLLWDGRLPDPARRESIARSLGSARVRAAEVLERVAPALAAGDGMDALRGAVALLEPRAEDAMPSVTGAIAVFLAAWWRRRRGLAIVAPDPARGHAEDLLFMVRGGASAAAAAALDTYLVTVADHGMNASTFAARVVASTGSDLVSAVVAALGALKGPLHGGAPGPVLDMLDAVGDPANARAWLAGELAAGRRIMGMGHRVYRVRDPRAIVLERAALRIAAAGHDTGGDEAQAWSRKIELARVVEREAEGLLAERHPARPLRANVEFYTALLLDMVGLDRALFTPLFAAARAAGWCAHVDEQRRTGRLIRPSSRYIGPMPSNVDQHRKDEH